METVSKNKRGRPTVYAREFGDDGGKQMEAINKATFSDLESARSRTDLIYYLEAHSLLSEQAEYRETWYTPAGNFKGKSVLVQIGRMRLQNNYSEESCRKVAAMAADYLKQGYTVRAVEKWIRHGRNTNEW